MNSRFPPVLKELLVHGFLLLLTFFTATLAGVYWNNKDPLELEYFSHGLIYAVLLILLLLSHEGGHYIAARIHGVSATLPYFIPFPSFLGLNPFGTMGAVIRLRSAVPSRKALFDIGAAGPISGFLFSVILLVIGFRTLPPITFLYEMHPEYASMATIPEGGLKFGSSLAYSLLASTLPPAGSFVPPMNEIYHYPFLCVGWFGLFVTAMNLIPVGQLDGGHIAYAAVGRKALLVARAAIILLSLLGTAGFLPLLGVPFQWGWSGWLFWAILLIAFTRGLRKGADHFQEDEELDSFRLAIAVACALILIGSFSLSPMNIDLP
jgi:membrane-associated protease RseP (regulator of RpoE activity)